MLTVHSYSCSQPTPTHTLTPFLCPACIQQEQPPGQVLHTSHPEQAAGRRKHLINKFRGKVISIDQIKNVPSPDNVLVMEPHVSTYKDTKDHSYCADNYDRFEKSSKLLVWNDATLLKQITELLTMIRSKFGPHRKQ
eukprot:m.118616 g.118616  ORF g.118616 m.118616 type:complete len:137 (-) comp10987_c1_seq2:137-547(-)